MIKSITLKNWKSFGEATLYVDPLTVVIGTNASGKSNFLDALVFLGELMRTTKVDAALNGGSGYGNPIRGGDKNIIRYGTDKAELEVVIVEENSVTSYRYKLIIGYGSGNQLIIAEEELYLTVGKDNPEVLTFLRGPYDKKNDNADISLPANPEEDVSRIRTRANTSMLFAFMGANLPDGFLISVSNVVKNLYAIKVYDPIPQHMRHYAPISPLLLKDASNLAGYLVDQSAADQLRVEHELLAALRHLPENEIVKIWAEPIGRLATDAMLYCEERWPGSKKTVLVDANGLSDGTLRLVAILSALLTAERGSTLVIEEIDNGIHPSRAELLVKLLHKIGTERKVDIICTTHNPALLDAFGLSMLPFIAMVYRDPETGTSQVKNLDEIEHYERIITKGSLGDLITKGRFESVLKAS